VLVAALAVGCPAPATSRGPARPGGSSAASADEKDAATTGAGARADSKGEHAVDKETIAAGDKGGAGAGFSAGELKRKKEQPASEDAVKLKKGTVEAPPPPPAEARPATDALPGLDLSEAQCSAVIAPRLERARRALAARELDKAIAEARSVLEVDSESVEGLLLLARAYFDRGWLPKAQQILVTGTQTGKGADSARLWMMLGLVHDRSGEETTQARDAYARAAKLKPNYAKAWTNLGAAQLELGDDEAAVAALETALSIDSESVVALTNLGTAYRRRAAALLSDRSKRDDLVQKSENAYRTALAVDETYAPAHFDLGLLYLETNDFPGRPDLDRLRLAVRHLREYERLTAGGAARASQWPAADEYLETAQRALTSGTTSGTGSRSQLP